MKLDDVPGRSMEMSLGTNSGGCDDWRKLRVERECASKGRVGKREGPLSLDGET